MALQRDHHRLREQVRRRAERLTRARKERATVIVYTGYLGVLGLLFVLPVVAGAYLGRWLDGLYSGYSVRWTVSLIVLGVFVGGLNVYLFIRE